jgi:hypothetical protein
MRIVDLPHVERLQQYLCKIFEGRACFCKQIGTNLRKKVVHGLLDFQACKSTVSVYAWWLSYFALFLMVDWVCRYSQNRSKKI